MPTYEYQCRACEHYFEQYQSIMADPLKKCPACGRLRLERLISAGAGIIFKGSGFYETDYRSDSYKKEAKKEKEAPAASKADTSDSSSAKKETDTKKPKDKKKD